MQKKKPIELQKDDVILYRIPNIAYIVCRVVSADKVWNEQSQKYNVYPKVREIFKWNGIPNSPKGKVKTLYIDEYVVFNEEYEEFCKLYDNDLVTIGQNIRILKETIKRQAFFN